MNQLGKTIRILRHAKNMRLNALAKAAGVSVPFLSLVENGDRQPSLGVLRKIAKGLGVPSEAMILMSIEPKSGLRSVDSVTNELTKSLNKMIDLEEQLQNFLGETEGTDAHSKDQPG